MNGDFRQRINENPQAGDTVHYFDIRLSILSFIFG